MKKSERIAEYILNDIRRNVPYGKDNMSDEEIDKKTNFRLLDHYLSWHGIIGFTGMIITAVSDIYEVKLKEEE
jgi:hypothetical protein